MKLKIILDRAHGNNVAGKCSPDGKHKEWQWSDKMCNLISNMLQTLGYQVFFTAPEHYEPGLLQRVHRMNQVSSPAFVLSIHNNAAPGEPKQWKKARGYSLYTTNGVTKSDYCADIIFNELRTAMPEIHYRVDMADGDIDFEENFTVLTSKHPSVLIEWLFQDNKEDIIIIQNDSYNKKLAEAIVKSIIKIEQFLCTK